MTLACTIEPTARHRRSPPLCDTLRAATEAAHVELEHSLGLLGRIPDRQWFAVVVERFFGFHLVWERAIASRPELRAFHQPRSRLPHLRRDLAALGLTTVELDDLPICREAERLVRTLPSAVGSIYVMEGSTLGGQLISRALADAEWLPAGGLTYFHPYGDRTGRMWRSFRDWAEGEVDAEDHDAAVDGANRTFGLLREWLAA